MGVDFAIYPIRVELLSQEMLSFLRIMFIGGDHLETLFWTKIHLLRKATSWLFLIMPI